MALGAFFVLALGVSACGSGVPGDSVAVVAGNPITKQAFQHWLFIAAKGQASQSPGSPVIVPDPPDFKKCIATAKTLPTLAKLPEKTLKSDCQQVFTQLRDQVLGFLIRSYWYQALAHQQGVKVTDAQVLKAFNAAKNQQFPTATQYQTFLTQSGQTQADITYRFRVNQIYTRLISKQSTNVTPAAIQTYYNSHKSQFGTPRTLNMRIVLTKTQAQAQAAMAALKGGASWKATAKKYSTDPSTKNIGGQLPNVTQGQQDAALNAAAFSAPVQKLEGPVKGQFGFYVFKVTSAKPASQQTLAEATPQIKALLGQQGSTSSQTAVDNKAKKAYLKQTKCRSGYVMLDCSGYKAPKPVTPSVPTPSQVPTVPATPTTSSTTPTPTTTTKH
jgi:parvulin-like peptidyl-prolyl isomerase